MSLQSINSQLIKLTSLNFIIQYSAWISPETQLSRGFSVLPERGNVPMQGINFLLDLAVYRGCTKANLGS